MITTIAIDSDRKLVISNVYKAKIGIRVVSPGGTSSVYELDAEELLQAVKAHYAIAKQDR